MHGHAQMINVVASAVTWGGAAAAGALWRLHLTDTDIGAICAVIGAACALTGAGVQVLAYLDRRRERKAIAARAAAQ